MRRARGFAEAGVFIVAALVVAASAYTMKRSHVPVGLSEVAPAEETRPVQREVVVTETTEIPELPAPETHGDLPEINRSEIRWFDGKAVRPAKIMWMTVTAYSPDHRSCGEFADGITASNKSVWTNAGRLVAADTSILPFGSMLTIPGYADDMIVPVLDRGGAIKGSRLDLLYPTHKEALQWGVQRLPVVVWEEVGQ